MVLVRGADVSQEALEIEREQRRAAEGGVDITRDGVQRAIEAAKRTAPPPQDPLLGEMRRLGRSTGRRLGQDQGGGTVTLRLLVAPRVYFRYDASVQMFFEKSEWVRVAAVAAEQPPIAEDEESPAHCSRPVRAGWRDLDQTCACAFAQSAMIS